MDGDGLIGEVPVPAPGSVPAPRASLPAAHDEAAGEQDGLIMHTQCKGVQFDKLDFQDEIDPDRPSWLVCAGEQEIPKENAGR